MDRNFVLAIALSLGVILAWDMLVAGPERARLRETQEAARIAQAEQADQQSEQAPQNPEIDGLQGLQSTAAEITVDEALSNAPGRIQIKTQSLDGSINLQGGRVDDLKLLQYRETVEPDSPNIRLLSPRETKHGHYAQVGWFAPGGASENAIWKVAEGAILTPATPVTLTREANGLVFEKTIAVDEEYMFTITQKATNNTSQVQSLTPYALVIQRNIPTEKNRGGYILHEGPLGVVGGTLYQRKYRALRKNKNKAVKEIGTGGWVGITNKNWLAAIVAPENQQLNASLDNVGDQENPIFRATYALPAEDVAPGQSVTIISHMFGGPKEVDILQAYQKDVYAFSPDKQNAGGESNPGVVEFDKAIDWGHLFFLTRPILYTLKFFGHLTGNFGIAILILTLIIKALLFPLANKGYESMSKMKKLQPEIEKLRTRYGEDKVKLQQEMMGLYKKEKMNPMAGCLPIILQMPIFFALYKTLFVTIELRHKPFLYIHDLASRDPTSVFNLFGLLPYDPTALPLIGTMLALGLLPLLMGIAMWFQTKLNPPPTDPVQAQIFGMMPFVFVFIFAPFAAGLVLYWFWNTTLSILQQWLIMKRNGVSVDWGARFKLPGKKTPAPGE